MYNKRFS